MPAVVHVTGKGYRCLGNGRAQWAKRRRFYARRKELQRAKSIRAVRKGQGKEASWMRDINHKLSHRIVAHAKRQGVGIVRMQRLAGTCQGINRRTARASRGADGRKVATARKNDRLIATLTFHQLASFMASKAERAGIAAQ